MFTPKVDFPALPCILVCNVPLCPLSQLGPKSACACLLVRAEMNSRYERTRCIDSDPDTQNCHRSQQPQGNEFMTPKRHIRSSLLQRRPLQKTTSDQNAEIRGPGPNCFIYNSFTRGSGNITKEEIERLQSLEDQKICCEIVSARNNKEIYPR